MSVVIVCQGLVGPLSVDAQDPDTGKYLESYDPDYLDGLGAWSWTSDRAKAVRFKGIADAFDTWKRRSSIRPTRSDGRPNRPLTAYSVTFEDIQP